jgi:hypothetical protein
LFFVVDCPVQLFAVHRLRACQKHAFFLHISLQFLNFGLELLILFLEGGITLVGIFETRLKELDPLFAFFVNLLFVEVRSGMQI